MATRTKIRSITRTKTETAKQNNLRIVNSKSATFTDSEESDPDFVNGAVFLEEPKKKRQIAIRAPKHLSPHRPQTALSSRGSSFLLKEKLKIGGSTFLCSENPLKEWLGSDLDVSSAEEPEEDGKFEWVEPEEEEEEEYASDTYDNEPLSSPPRKRAPIKPRNSVKSKPPPSNSKIRSALPVKIEPAPTVLEDDSAIEPESDTEKCDVKPVLNHRSPPVAVLLELQPASGDESVTEPESDEEYVFLGKRKTSKSPATRPAKRVKVEANDSDDSVTEPESGEEQSGASSQTIKHELINPNAPPPSVKQSCHPRPAFKLTALQPPIGPFVLDEARGIQVTSAINRWLRDYQREGAKFFYERYKEGRGGILGDDMGLGKTIQVIAFLSAIMKKTGDNRDRNRRQEHVDALQDSETWHTSRRVPPANATWPTCLIIAPASLTHNWARELAAWGYFEVGVLTGTRDERTAVRRDFELGRLDVVVTSIELAVREIALLESQTWSCVFIDEVHRVKNPKSKTCIALNRLDCTVRFGLTGTAIQNNYSEIWTILDWSNPGRVGTLAQWTGWVSKPLEKGQNSKATDEEFATARIVADRLVNKLLPNFFKRRTKDIIADQLPKKIDQVVFCPLTEMQKRVYKRFLATHEVQTMLKKDELCECGSGKIGKKCCLPKWEKGWVFEFVNILMKISNHLALILPAPIDTPDQTLRHRRQANIAWPPVNGVPTAPSYGEAVFDPRLCGKWKVLKDLLTAWHNEGDNKVLIFTKSVKLIEMLEQRLKESFMEFRKLDGSVKQKDRMTLVDQFNGDPKVFIFLISIMAGGVGLNLVGANKVVIFDPSWNPAQDLQAQDRAFRFGQRRDVSVYRFLGAGSLEELIYKRQIYKQQQMKIGYEASHQTRYFEGVQGDKSNQGDLFGLKNVFTLDEAETTTKHTIEKSHLAQLDWALAHLEGKANRKGISEEGVALDEKAAKSKVGFKGLGALFFGTGEDALPKQPPVEDDIKKILNSNGVSYTHYNDTLLKASTIETKLTSKAIEERKKRADNLKKVRGGKGMKKETEEAPWPPKRKHHKLQAPRKARLSDRMEALITLGHINAPGDLFKFAEDFVKKSEEEQAFLLGKLDEETARLELEDDQMLH